MKGKWTCLAGVALSLSVLATVTAAESGETTRLEQLDLTDEQQEQLQALREEYRQAVNEMLTDAQRTKLKTLRDEAFYGGHRFVESIKESIEGIRQSIEHWDDMREFAKLDLTDQQREQLKALHAAQRAAFDQWRQQQHEAAESILTDAQRAKLKTLKDEAFYGGGHRFVESVKESIEGIRQSIEPWDNMRDLKSAFSRLDLTDQQREQLEALHAAQRAAFDQWRQQRHEAAEGILTAAQRAKLKTLKDEAFYGRN